MSSNHKKLKRDVETLELSCEQLRERATRDEQDIRRLRHQLNICQFKRKRAEKKFVAADLLIQEMKQLAMTKGGKLRSVMKPKELDRMMYEINNYQRCRRDEHVWEKKQRCKECLSHEVRREFRRVVCNSCDYQEKIDGRLCVRCNWNSVEYLDRVPWCFSCRDDYRDERGQLDENYKTIAREYLEDYEEGEF